MLDVLKVAGLRLLGAPVLSLLAFWLAAGSVARAESVVLEPLADALLASAKPDNNYGGGGALLVAAAATPKGEFQSLLRFDTAAVKNQLDASFGSGQWIVSQVALQVASNSVVSALFGAPAAGSVRVHSLLNSGWAEGTGTPNAPTADGITFGGLTALLSPGDENLGAFAVGTSTPTNYDFHLLASPTLSGRIHDGQILSLRLDAADDLVTIAFGSRTNNNAALHPALMITAVAVPEPAAWATASSGMLLIGWLCRRCSTRAVSSPAARRRAITTMLAAW